MCGRSEAERHAHEENTKGRKSRSSDLRAEYAFDYGQARPNRFAARMSGDVVAVVLDADVARVFDSSKRVNDFLRSAISAMPARERKVRGTRRKAG